MYGVIRKFFPTLYCANLCSSATVAIHSPFGRPLHVFMVGRDRERGCNAKCAANEDDAWLHVYDHGNITYQAVGVMKAARFGFFLVRTRTNMDLNKLVIFAHQQCASPPRFGHSPPPHTYKTYASHRAPSPSRRRGKGVKAVGKQQSRPTSHVRKFTCIHIDEIRSGP